MNEAITALGGDEIARSDAELVHLGRALVMVEDARHTRPPPRTPGVSHVRGQRINERERFRPPPSFESVVILGVPTNEIDHLAGWN